ncbi:MAG TPA: CrcB family protein [Pyrinomonadaceae bacterium]|nr:CrcB family protein [Pyrinomonadaceae bacterium]
MGAVKKILLIGLAGMAGTLRRYWLSPGVGRRYEGRLPLDTIAVNVIGCFAIGFLFHLMRERYAAGEAAAGVVMVGLLVLWAGYSLARPLLPA